MKLRLGPCIYGVGTAISSLSLAKETYSIHRRAVAQVSVVAGAGAGVCRSRCGKRMGTCAAKTRRTQLRGSGPQAEIPPAPRKGYTCSHKGDYLRQAVTFPADNSTNTTFVHNI